MLLAQADVTASGLTDFAGKFGFPALLVIVLLLGIYKMLAAATTEREKRDDRDEKREEARRVEREADRKAHVDALMANTATLGTLVEKVADTGRKVEALADGVRSEFRVVRGSGG
jgi:predicted protein tyrosine phosphatase